MDQETIFSVVELLQRNWQLALLVFFVLVFLVTAPSARPENVRPIAIFIMSNFAISRMSFIVCLALFGLIFLVDGVEVYPVTISETENENAQLATSSTVEIDGFQMELARETPTDFFYRANLTLNGSIPDGFAFVPVIEDGFANNWLQGTGWINSVDESGIGASSLIPIGKQSTYPLKVRYYLLEKAEARRVFDESSGRVTSIDVYRNTPVSDTCTLNASAPYIEC